MFRAAPVAALCGGLLPHGEGVCAQWATLADAFVLKDNVYEVESYLHALMREGTHSKMPLRAARIWKTHLPSSCTALMGVISM